MDLERFQRELPELYENWGSLAVQPRSERFAPVLAQVRGMTTPSVLQLLNLAVGCLEEGECYLEVGCFQGATLIGALLDHPGGTALAVDNFSEFDPTGENERLLHRNLQEFGVAGQVRFEKRHSEDYLLGLRGQGMRVGVYLYDGGHDYRSQLLGLLLAVPLLAERALIVVDDSNFAAVQQATWDFLAVEPRCRLVLELPTPGNCHGSFWNGLMVLGWETNDTYGYTWTQLKEKQQHTLLQSLDALQSVQLRQEGKGVRMSWMEAK